MTVRSIKEMMDLKGRVAVITGGAGHIALAFAESLAEAGASLVLLDVGQARLESRTADLMRRFGCKVTHAVADVANPEMVNQALSRAEAEHGSIDILMNNAAYPPDDRPDPFDVAAQSVERWERNIQVMLTGTLVTTQACVPAMRRAGSGTIINVSSTYGLVGPDPAMYLGTEIGNPGYYAAAKGGIVQLTRYWATMLAPVIRVNCIAPGGVSRNQPEIFVERYGTRTPLKRMATEEDFKGAALFLASDMSAYVTGQVLPVDGGWTAW